MFGVETWVLSTVMEKCLVVIHTGFLQKVTIKRAKRSSDVTCQQQGAESVLKAAGTQDVRTYINKIK